MSTACPPPWSAKKMLRRLILTICIVTAFLTGSYAAFRYPHLFSKTSIVRNLTGWVLGCNHRINPNDAKPIAVAFLNRALVRRVHQNWAHGFIIAKTVERLSNHPNQADIFVVGFRTSKIVNGWLVDTQGEVRVTECGRVIDFKHPTKGS